MLRKICPLSSQGKQDHFVRTFGFNTGNTCRVGDEKMDWMQMFSLCHKLKKTMLRYQYVLANTTSAQGDFARTAGTWANQIRILQEQIKKFASVIGTGFIAAFKPFVQTLNKSHGESH